LVNRYRQKTNTIYKTQSVDNARANGNNIALLEPAKEVFDEYKSEKVRTLEIGYRGLFANGRLLVDANYFYNNYIDFAAEIDVTQAIPNGLRNDPGPFDPNSDAGKTAIVQRTVATQRYALDVNAKGTIQSHGWGLQADYSLPKGYKVGGNVSFNELISQEELIKEGLQVDFNTPRYRYNLSFSNRAVTKKLGFNVTWRWQDAFIWQSAIGVGVVPEFGTLDAQLSYKIPTIKTMLKIGGANILNQRYTTSFANPSLGGVYYLQLTFDQFFN
jgi:outer membrane receptor protein involved in Fe transport